MMIIVNVVKLKMDPNEGETRRERFIRRLKKFTASILEPICVVLIDKPLLWIILRAEEKEERKAQQKKKLEKDK